MTRLAPNLAVALLLCCSPGASEETAPPWGTARLRLSDVEYKPTPRPFVRRMLAMARVHALLHRRGEPRRELAEGVTTLSPIHGPRRS